MSTATSSHMPGMATRKALADALVSSRKQDRSDGKRPDGAGQGQDKLAAAVAVTRADATHADQDRLVAATSAEGVALKPSHPVVRWLWLILAYVSLGLAIVAVFLPGIPSTEFVLLSAWAASKGSPRLRAWLLRHRLFGPIIHNWQHGRVVTRRAKLGASVSMSVALLIMVWTMPEHRVLVAVLAVGMACGAAWMWSRPERIPEA